MLRFAAWKVAAILGMTLVALLVILPSTLSPEARDSLRGWVPKFIPLKTMVLGLDLQGGSHVLLEVDSASVLRTQVENLRDDARRVLREERVPITGGIGLQTRGVQFRLANKDDAGKVTGKIQTTGQVTGNTLSGAGGGSGIDVAVSNDGVVAATITDVGVNDKVRRAVDQSIEVLRRRIDALGHDRTQHPAAGQRPHPRAGAGPARPREAQGDSRHDREARVPFGGRTRREPG